MADVDTPATTTTTHSGTTGLLITTDPLRARAFQREIDNSTDCDISFDLQSNFGEAMRSGGGRYQCVVIDLEGSITPTDAVKMARKAWPAARIAVLTFWWSEQSDIAQEAADIVIHKPLRAAELQAFLRSPFGAPMIEDVEEAALARAN